MSKIWLVTNNGGRKYFKTEAAFMDYMTLLSRRSNSNRAIVTIYQEVESHNALEYKNNLITQREREHQLQIILEDNKEIEILCQIKNELKNIYDKNNATMRVIMKNFDNRGLSVKEFKKLVADQSVRKFLLYKGPSSKEWYKLLRQVHGFKMESEYPILYDWKTKSYKKQKVEPERLENFKLACEELKKEKKK